MPTKVVNYRSKVPEGSIVVNTTSHSAVNWQKQLSPFNLGPVEMTLHLAFPDLPRFSENMENAWQYSKVYARHATADGTPTVLYFSWANAGFRDREAKRFPMGKGAKPLYSLFVNPMTHAVERLGYVEARKKIYAHTYAKAVVKTEGYEELKKLVSSTGATVYLRDFDGYDAKDKTFLQVLDDPNRKMGHAFVLARLIEMDV